MIPVGIRPILVKDRLERSGLHTYEGWNSYSRIVASHPQTGFPGMWGASPHMPSDIRVPEVWLDIDGSAGTSMFHYDETRDLVDFLRYDLVNLAYHLPGIHKSAVIGVGGGRDLLSAHLFGVEDITGVELNPIFIDLHVSNPFYREFSNLTKLPKLSLNVDDARSWFASTKEKFDLVQMSMIDTWAATGAGAFSLSENGLYTLEGWRAFLATINNKGFFTVSRWYNPGDANETGRMTGLAAAALLDAGIDDIRAHLFVARADHIATLILSKTAFTADELRTLRTSVANLGFEVLLAPDEPSDSAPALLRAITEARDIATLDRLGGSTYLDLTVPTDNRPFFFNQLRLTSIPDAASRLLTQTIRGGVLVGNLIASTTLLLILFISIVAVIATIVVPLRGAVRECHPPLIVAGSLYFSLIGVGFMFTEISLLQSFSVYLGHPIYALGICLFSLILSSGLGSLASDRIRLDTRGKLAGWGMIVALYLFVLELYIACRLPSNYRSRPSRPHLDRGNDYHTVGPVTRLCFSYWHATCRGCRSASYSLVLGDQWSDRGSRLRPSGDV